MTFHVKAGRLSAVRPALASHLFALPPTPFCRFAALPLKGKQEISVLSPCAFLGYRKHHRPLRPLEGERATKWRGGVLRYEPEMTFHVKAGRLSAVRPALASHLFALPPTPFCRFAALLHGKACHWIRGSLCSPMNPVPLPPSRGNKKFRL